MLSRIFFIFSRSTVILAIGLVLACQEEIPESILPPETFSPLLKEMLIAESGVEGLTISYSEKKEARDQRYRIICKEKGIEIEEFFKSFEYYRSHPEIMDSLYASILDELNEDLMQQRMNFKPELEAAITPHP